MDKVLVGKQRLNTLLGLGRTPSFNQSDYFLAKYLPMQDMGVGFFHESAFIHGISFMYIFLYGDVVLKIFCTLQHLDHSCSMFVLHCLIRKACFHREILPLVQVAELNSFHAKIDSLFDLSTY